MAEGRDVWTVAEAAAWAAGQPWRLGANYVPASAVNQLEMWQAATFDPDGIDRELGWAAGLGMNAVRVFLHDLVWRDDAAGFLARIDRFLSIAASHGIATMLVFFDSCWDPNPAAGPQKAPVPGVHNSRWAQSPGVAALADPAEHPRLLAYVAAVAGAFASDPRVFAWDPWNEPDSPGGLGYPAESYRAAKVTPLLQNAFRFVRSANPVQPLTSAVWRTGDWSPSGIDAFAALQLAESDILSFHDYRDAEGFAASAEQLLAYGRPVLATEYLARPAGSTFAAILPVARRLQVGAINWGLVDGRTQTKLSWQSWLTPFVEATPEPWYHDVLRADGTPYRAEEAALLRSLAPPQAATARSSSAA